MPGFKQVFVQALTEVSSTPKDSLGDIRIEGAKSYRYVKVRNTATVAGVAGDPVCYLTAAGSEDDGVAAVATRLADTAGVFAGCLAAPLAGVANTDYYCWVQQRGPVTFAGTFAIAAGTALKMGATDKTFAAGAAATDFVIGVSANQASKRILLTL